MRIVAVLALAFLAACASDGNGWPHPTDEQIAANAARREAAQPGINAREYARWTEALATGETVFTYLDSGGGRSVVTDVEVTPEHICYRVLAQRGSARHNDFWLNFDQVGQSNQNVCRRHAEVRFRPGDDRDR